MSDIYTTMTFKEFILKEASLRQILKPVPQNPHHHAEGDVFTHSRMVRSRLPHAVEFLRSQSQNPDSPLSNLDPRITPSEERILKMAAWLHDIGKASVTKWNPEKEKLTSHGHERPDSYMPQIERLSGPIRSIYDSLSGFERDVLHFVIDNHMSLQPGSGFPRRLLPELFGDDGKVRNEIKPKLLVIFILMDRTGRLRGEDFKPSMGFRDKQSASLANAGAELGDTIKHIKTSAEKHAEIKRRRS